MSQTRTHADRNTDRNARTDRNIHRQKQNTQKHKMTRRKTHIKGEKQ